VALVTRRPVVRVIILAAVIFGLWGVIDFLRSNDATQPSEFAPRSVAARGASAASSPPTVDPLLDLAPLLEPPVEVLTGPVTSRLSPWARRSIGRNYARSLEEPEESSTLEDTTQVQEEAQPADEEDTDADEEAKRRAEEEAEKKEEADEEAAENEDDDSSRSNRDEEDAISDGSSGQSTSLSARQLLENKDDEPPNNSGTPGKDGTGNPSGSQVGQVTDGGAENSG
jgi:type IV secretory pathway VirB10-like protein